MYEDPYNYPTPTRNDLMSLNTIQPNRDQMKTTTKSFVTNRQTSSSLNTNDIQGAQPKLHGSRVVQREEYANKNWDIAQSYPRPLHMGLDRKEFNLTNKDIEKSSPNIVKFKTNRLDHNPLAPQYALPQVDIRPVTPPKFIRDNINHDDIDGSKPKKVAHYETRNILDLGDIEGSHPKKFKPRQAQYNNLDYSDITKAHFKTKRVIDPLNPVYDLKDDTGEVKKYGEIIGNHPKPMIERKKGDVSTSLATKDIEGATPGTKGQRFVPNSQERDKRNPNSIDDIEGTKSGSLKKGPTTNRCVNPLAPNYEFPGAKELGSTNNPFGTSATSLQTKAAGRTSLGARPPSQTFNAPEATSTQSNIFGNATQQTNQTAIQPQTTYSFAERKKTNQEALGEVSPQAAISSHAEYSKPGSAKGSVFQKNTTQSYGAETGGVNAERRINDSRSSYKSNTSQKAITGAQKLDSFIGRY